MHFTTYARNREKSVLKGGGLILRHGRIIRILRYELFLGISKSFF